MKRIHVGILTHTWGFKSILDDTLEVLCSVRLEHNNCPSAAGQEDCSKEMYKTLPPNCEVVSTQRLCDSFSRVQISGAIYRCSRNYGVLAEWFNGECRPGRVCRFLTHDVVVKQDRSKRQKLTFVLAEVDWFKAHPERNWFPDSLKVWCTDFESHSAEMSFIPAQRIHSQCLTVQYEVKFDYGGNGCYYHSIAWKIYLMNLTHA